MVYYLSNAFSLGMLSKECFPHSGEPDCTLQITEISLLEARTAAQAISNLVSAVGHEDTARLYSQVLGAEIGFNRITVRLRRFDTLIVGQYTGPRLPEGAVVLPDGATITWYRVSVR